MKDIKLVLSDIDGTLIDDDEILPDEVNDLAIKLSEKGIIFTLATGRMPFEMQRLIKRLGISEALIFANGAIIAKGPKILSKTPINIEKAFGAIDEMQKLGMSIVISFADADKVINMTPYLREKSEKFNRNYIEIAMDFQMVQTNEIYKIQIYNYDDKQNMDKWADLFRSSLFGNGFSVTQYENRGIELGSKGIDKGYGLKKLIEFYGISEQEVLAIGNHTNDMEMIQTAGIGVCVANGSDALKKNSNYVCQRSGGLGVLEAIEKFCL